MATESEIGASTTSMGSDDLEDQCETSASFAAVESPRYKAPPPIGWGTPVILEGFIERAKNTIVLAGPRIHDALQRFSIVLADSLATGSRLDPFGTPTTCDTLLAVGGVSRRLLGERLELMRRRTDNSRMRHLGYRRTCNLHVLNRQDADVDARYPNGCGGERAFMRHVPEDCEIVLFSDADCWVGTKQAVYSGALPFASLHAELNRRGVATVSFVNSTKGLSDLESSALLDPDTIYLQFAEDPAAPREYGGGFTVTRRRMSEHDSIPLRFQAWTYVKAHELIYGWVCRDPAETLATAKQIEVAERQRRVAELNALNIEQKDIAERLEVSASTVSRDLAKIRGQSRSSQEAEPINQPTATAARTALVHHHPDAAAASDLDGGRDESQTLSQPTSRETVLSEAIDRLRSSGYLTIGRIRSVLTPEEFDELMLRLEALRAVRRPSGGGVAAEVRKYAKLLARADRLHARGSEKAEGAYEHALLALAESAELCPQLLTEFDRLLDPGFENEIEATPEGMPRPLSSRSPLAVHEGKPKRTRKTLIAEALWAALTRLRGGSA